MVHETVVLEGHLIDSDIMRRVFDRVVEGGGAFEVQEFRVGRTNDEGSYARIDVRAEDPEDLDAIVESLRYIGAVSESGPGSCVFAPAEADGILPDEFYSTAKTISGTSELREALTDARIPMVRKQGIVGDLLDPRVSGVVVASINFLIAVGEARSLEEVASRVAQLAAEEEGTVVAEVQSAVALDAGQVARLEAALSKATGKRVQAKVVTDPALIGGLVAKIGDTVFDGSVKSRFADVREQWG